VRGRPAPVSAAAAAETPLFAGQRWFEPDLDDLCRQLRAVAADPANARARGAAARRHVLALCEPSRIAAAFAAMAAELAAVPSGSCRGES
jgi:hypothetical protein